VKVMPSFNLWAIKVEKCIMSLFTLNFEKYQIRK